MISMRFPTLMSRAAVGAALLVVPVLAQAQVSLLSPIVEEHQATTGETYTGRLVLSNPTTTPQIMRIYQKDFSFHADGTNTDADPGTTPRSNASWVTPQGTQVTVPARGELTVPYSVRVPASDSLKGTYWSMIYIEGAQSAPTTTGANGNVGIATVIRYGVQIATHIGTTGTRKVEFVKPNATHVANGDAALDLDVVNAGERAVKPKMSAQIFDMNGALKASAKQDRGLVYPGTSFRQSFSFGKLPPGTYKVQVIADTGDPKAIQGSTYTITY